jgi:hypothetical protein
MTDRMTPETRLDIPVQVNIDGAWYDGFLEHWRKRNDRWQGYVRWSQGIGAQYIRWLEADRIRKA